MDNERKDCCKAPERVMMQCRTRVDDERQVVVSGWEMSEIRQFWRRGEDRVVRERKPISRGRPEQVSASSARWPSVHDLTHARRRGLEAGAGRVPDWGHSERARCGPLQVGESSWTDSPPDAGNMPCVL